MPLCVVLDGIDALDSTSTNASIGVQALAAVAIQVADDGVAQLQTGRGLAQFGNLIVLAVPQVHQRERRNVSFSKRSTWNG